jgi:hypothetical protein
MLFYKRLYTVGGIKVDASSGVFIVYLIASKID